MIPLFGLFLARPQVSPELLAVWRKQDRLGRSCAMCHSPDGLELSSFGFDKADIVRRASKHLGEPDRARILELLSRPVPEVHSAMHDRPLQPGGLVLPGGSAPARDLQFAVELQRKLPRLMGAPIRSLAQAQAARDELLNQNLRELRIGIEFNRLSEDGFHGGEHATIAHWIPDTPVVLSSEVLTAQDDYLSNPSILKLRQIDEAVQRANRPLGGLASLSLVKYRSLLVLTHRLRTGATEPVTLTNSFGANPMWIAAEFSRIYANSTPALFAVPVEIAQAKTVSWRGQMKSIRLPWYWLGWMEDPALVHSGLTSETKSGHYFVNALLDDGPYPVHAAFVVGKRMVEKACREGSGHPEVQFSALFASNRVASAEPKSPLHARLYRTLVSNTFRMICLLVLDDLRKTGRALVPESQLAQIKLIQSYCNIDRSLVRDLSDKLRRAEPEMAKLNG